MRRLHLAIGLCTVVLFLISGQLMRHHTPPMDTLSPTLRLLHRSRHIYILMIGLVNLVLGLYMQPTLGKFRVAAQRLGSALLLMSAGLSVVAFAVEPALGFRPDMLWSRFALYSVFAGCVLHFFSAATFARNVAARRAAAASDSSHS